MENILLELEHAITAVSNAIWPVFLPFILVLGAIASIRTIFIVRKETTLPAKLNIKNIIGPASISLGAMIGTGAIIGVLGALSKLSASGQPNIEAMAFWALVGSAIMIPVSYAETLSSKIMRKTPKEYIADLVSPGLGQLYAVCFVALAVFGFGGFQFSGIDSVAAIITVKFAGVELSLMQRYIFIVVPIILVVSALILSKKHDVFIGAMASMIGIAVVGYFAFFILFVFRTTDYMPIYFDKMIQGVMNPVSAMLGIPLGLVLGLQKVIQTAETGLGALAMAAQESEAPPREAATISLIPTTITVFVSIVVTSYIVSYGVYSGVLAIIDDTGAQTSAVVRLLGYFETAQLVTGMFGLIILSLFTVLSALTTILGSYYYTSKLFKENHENKNITIYLVLVVLAGTLAVFGANVVFEAVDLLLFVLSGLNVLALVIFTFGHWEKYKNNKN